MYVYTRSLFLLQSYLVVFVLTQSVTITLVEWPKEPYAAIAKWKEGKKSMSFINLFLLSIYFCLSFNHSTKSDSDNDLCVRKVSSKEQHNRKV